MPGATWTKGYVDHINFEKQRLPIPLSSFVCFSGGVTSAFLQKAFLSLSDAVDARPS